MKVEFNNPEFETGHEFDIGGLLLVNGKAVEISDEEAALYEARNGRPLSEALKGVRFAKVGGKKTEAAKEGDN